MTGAAGRDTATAAVLAQWDQWLGDATDRLMDLDGRTTGSADAVRMDVAAAFVCRKAIAARVEAMRTAVDATKLAKDPVLDDEGALVANDLEQAATLLGAVLDRVESTIDADESAARQLADDTMNATADLAVADRLAEQLGQYVQRAAAVRAQLDSAGRRPDALHAAAVDAAALRDELETTAAERDDAFARWSSLPARLEQLRARERDVRAVVDRCREKVQPLPTLALPAVDALGQQPTIDHLRSEPWPAARAEMQPLLARVERLAAAFDEVERRYAAVLSRRDELRGLLHAFRDKAGASGFAEHADLEPVFREAERELWSAPCDVEAAAGLVERYTHAVNAMINTGRQSARDRGER